MATAIARRLVRLAYPHGSVRRVWRGPGAGLRFRVQPSMGFTYALGYDTHHTWWLQNVVRAGMSVYDIGANVGQVAMQFSKWVGEEGHVVAIEPAPANVFQLEENLALNSITNVTVIEAAASDTVGFATFLLDPEKARMGKLEDCEQSYNEFCRRDERFEVPTVRIDDLVQQRSDHPDLLKIDVEGGARLVLAGAQETLRRHRPAIYIELHGPEEREAVAQLIRPNGYRLTNLSGQLVTDPVADPANPIWCIPETA